ncbi:MAG: (2Fe-2S) ferredoxin domain-containing protein [Cyanobacteria bacterium P01_A01_bin.123]
MPIEQRVLICQNTTCRKSGAQLVLREFQRLTPTHITVKGVGCLGECGNGPMAVVLVSDVVWYSHLQIKAVPIIVERHLLKGEPVTSMQYKK